LFTNCIWTLWDSNPDPAAYEAAALTY